MEQIKIKRKFNTKVVTWREAIDNLNQSIDSNKDVRHIPPAFWVAHHAHEMTKVKTILKKLKLKFAHLYVNFIKSNTLGKHHDWQNVWFWQCQGKTKWIIKEKEEYILSPGDLIYVPKNWTHEVIALSHRIGISMSDT